MSVDAIKALLDPAVVRPLKLTHAEWRVAAGVADRVNAEYRWHYWEGATALARRCCMDERNVRRLIGQLVDKGVLECVADAAGTRPAGYRWLLNLSQSGTDYPGSGEHQPGTGTRKTRGHTSYRTQGTQRARSSKKDSPADNTVGTRLAGAAQAERGIAAIDAADASEPSTTPHARLIQDRRLGRTDAETSEVTDWSALDAAIEEPQEVTA